jgi:hypothetical protein
MDRDRSWTYAKDWLEDGLSGQAKGGDSMRPTGVTANLSVADLADARNFYVDFSVLASKIQPGLGRQTPNLQTAARSSN